MVITIKTILISPCENYNNDHDSVVYIIWVRKKWKLLSGCLVTWKWSSSYDLGKLNYEKCA